MKHSREELNARTPPKLLKLYLPIRRRYEESLVAVYDKAPDGNMPLSQILAYLGDDAPEVLEVNRARTAHTEFCVYLSSRFGTPSMYIAWSEFLESLGHKK